MIIVKFTQTHDVTGNVVGGELKILLCLHRLSYLSCKYPLGTPEHLVVTPQTGTIGTDEGLMVIVVCRLLEGALVVKCASCCGGAVVAVSRGLDRAAAEATTGCVRSNCRCYCLNFLLMFQEKFFGVEPHADFCRPRLVLLQPPCCSLVSSPRYA